MKGKIIPYSIVIACLYFTLFNFPLAYFRLPGGTKNLLYIFLLGIILVYGKAYFNFVKVFSKELWLLFLPLLFVLLRTGIGGETEFIGKHVLGLLDTFFVPLSLVLFAIKSGITIETRFIRCILVLGAVASVISFACFLSPSLQSYVKYTVLNIQPDNYLYWNTFRGFGLAQALTSSYAYIQGSIFVIGCFYAKDNKWFLYFLPLVLLSVLLNARTGIVILIVGLIIFVLTRKSGFKTILLSIPCLLVFLFIPEIMSSMGLKSNTIEWVLVVFSDMDNIVTTGDVTQTGVGGKLFETMWILPETSSEWLIGKGYSLFRHEVETSSDNGWILQLNYGGIIYMFFLYLIIFQILFRLYKIRRKSFALYFLFIFLIINTKSSFLPNDEEFRMLMMIYMFYILIDRNLKLNKRNISYDKSFLRSI